MKRPTGPARKTMRHGGAMSRISCGAGVCHGGEPNTSSGPQGPQGATWIRNPSRATVTATRQFARSPCAHRRLQKYSASACRRSSDCTRRKTPRRRMVEFDVPFFIGAINMAALCSDSGKIGTTYRVLRRLSDAKRHTIRLDRVSKKIAETSRRMIESLEAAKAAGHSPNREAAEWVGRVSGEIHSRLERAGLVPPRQKAASAARTLGQHRDQGQRLL